MAVAVSSISDKASKRVRATEPSVDDGEAQRLEELAGINPQVRMEFVDAMTICHQSDTFDASFAKWKYKAEPEAVETLHQIIGTWWRIGEWAGRPLWVRSQEASLPL